MQECIYFIYYNYIYTIFGLNMYNYMDRLVLRFMQHVYINDNWCFCVLKYERWVRRGHIRWRDRWFITWLGTWYNRWLITWFVGWSNTRLGTWYRRRFSGWN